jgi:hypothetical protein
LLLDYYCGIGVDLGCAMVGAADKLVKGVASLPGAQQDG